MSQVLKYFLDWCHNENKSLVKKALLIGSQTDSDEEPDPCFNQPSKKKKIPLIGLLVQGSPKSVDHILMYLKNMTPVVVMKGSGGLADIISFAYEEYLER